MKKDYLYQLVCDRKNTLYNIIELHHNNNKNLSLNEVEEINKILIKNDICSYKKIIKNEKER